MRQPLRPVRPIPWVGRQLTRVGRLCQKTGRLAEAEVAFRAAVWLSAEVPWLIRLGRVQEARKHWAAAEETYSRCLAVIDRSPQDEQRRAVVQYRRARVLTRRKDWDGAEAAFTAALAQRPEIGTWHGHLGEVYAGREDWTAAAGAYENAIAFEPEKPEWVAGVVRAYTQAGRPDHAIEVAVAAPVEPTGQPKLAPALATAYQAVGDWRTAAALLRSLLAIRPRDFALRTRLVDCLEMLYLVPFTLDQHGLVEPSEEERKRQADDALAEAIEHLELLTAEAPNRPGAPFRLGLLHERSGQLSKAVVAYRLAMQRLATVDSWWCHRAANEWGFRYDYVRQDLASSLSPSGRLGRTVAPAARPTHPPDERVPPPAGFFDAVMYRHGLQMSGFLLPGPNRMVGFHLDDQLIKEVRVDTTKPRPALRFDLTHGLLSDFPERSRLTVRAGDQPLVTVGGAEALDVEVPGGTGEIGPKLASGLPITKKGSWPRTGSQLARRQDAYLRVYQRARELLDAQGRSLFLSYGTLLGCYREGRFIPGDDDFDAAYVSRAADPAEFRRECWRLACHLIQHGLDIKLAINGRLYQAGMDKVWIDICPMWYYRGRIWSFDAHDLTPDTFAPVQAGTFLGGEVYLPHDPEAFLADAYGPDWRVPQPYFRHYRSKADDRILAQMWAPPSEVREFARTAEAERVRTPEAGTFVGVGAPGYPGFSWLTSPDAPRPADL